ncbi:MAG: glycosyl transferase family 39 [Chloroflexi bacterium]|nr:glycosyl transferase family 39 [Chloroflexota bacterium]
MDDIAIYNQHYYVVFPPFPALVLLPFVALTGIENTRPMLVAIALTLLNFYLFTSILKKVGAQKQTIPWLVAAFFLGTGYWLELCWSTTVWHFAEIVAITCLLLALNEAFGKARGVLVGFFLGMAVLSRQNTIFSLIFLCIILWRVSYPSAQNKNRLLNQFGMFAALGIWGIFYLYLNWSRFGNIFDTGYAYILTAPGFLQERLARYGLFNIVYIPFNFIYLFLQGFQVQFDPANSYLSITNTSLFGTSLTFASPFLLIAFFAKWEKKYLRAAWVSIGCTLVLMLLYYNNGWWQLNAQRFTLDFMPILILLVAFGMQHVDKRIVQAAIGYSVALNIIALFIVPLVVILTNLSLPF